MTTISHDGCRQALALDERSADVDDHLDRCPACSRFAAGVRQLTEAAAAIRVPDPPPGLADRVLERTAAERARPMRARPSGRRSLYAGLAVAAAVALVLGTLAVVGRDTDSPREVLLAAATRTEEAGTATVQVEGGGEVAVPAGTGAADFSHAPDEIEGYMEREWARLIAEFERAIAEFERAMAEFDRALDDALRRFDDALEGGPRPPQPPPTPAPPARRGEPEPLPERATLGFAFSASGAVDFRDGVALHGSVRPVAGTVPAPDVSTEFAVTARSGDPAATGPLGAVLLSPDGITRLLRAAEGEVRVEGRVEVDGVATQRYRFRATGLDSSGVTRSWDVDAYIGADRLVRRVDLRASGRLAGNTAWTDRATVHLSAFGAGATLDGAGSASAAPVGSLPLHPFGPALAASLRAGR